MPSCSSFSLRCCERDAQGPGKDGLNPPERRGLGTVLWARGDMNHPQAVSPLRKGVLELGFNLLVTKGGFKSVCNHLLK